MNFIVKILSKIPFTILYLTSDILYIIVYKIVGYRKKIVRENINIAFGKKSKEERKIIEKKFYRNFADFLVESIKIFSMTNDDFIKRIKIKNIELSEKYKTEGKDIFFLVGHIFNWEWLTGIVKRLYQENTYAIYKDVSNKKIENEILINRSSFGTYPISSVNAVREILKTKNDGSNAFLFVADQRPHIPNIRYELNFYNKNTPVFNGYDLLVRKRNYIPIYIYMKRIKRGYYEIEFCEIKPNKENFEENEVVDKFYELLTNNINEYPSNWLWTHKRWKYKSGIDYQL